MSMDSDDSRTASEFAAAARRFGLCDVCGYVADFDHEAREIFCPVETEAHPDRPFRQPLPPTSPGSAVRFGDWNVEARAEFLKAATDRLPDRKPTGALWNCGRCGRNYEPEDVLVAHGKPCCWNCGAPRVVISFPATE